MRWPWSRRRINPGPGALILEDPEIGAGRFVEYAREKHGSFLDYSPRSIEMFEMTLQEISHVVSSMDAETRSAVTQDAAAYLLEVGRKEFGGVYKHFAPRNTLVLVVGEPDFSAAMLASDKVAGRIGGDEADNIPFNYEGFQDAVRNRRSELCV